MKRILAILLVAVAALAAGNLFGGGEAHAHLNPPGSNTATVTDHYAHMLLESIDGKDPRIVVVAHEAITHEWSLWLAGALGSTTDGTFGWPPTSGDYVTLTPHGGSFDTRYTFYVVNEDSEIASPYIQFRTLANGTQGYYIPKIDKNNQTADSVTFTLTFKDAGNHAVALSTDGTTPITETETTLVSEGVLDTVTHTVSGLEQGTEYTILASQVNGSADDATASRLTFTTDTCNEGLCSIPQQDVNEGETVNYVIPVTNPEGADTTWSITSGQKGDAAINTTTGRFTWTTTEADGGSTHEFGINVLVGTNSSDGTLAVMVNETNQAPVFTTNKTTHDAFVGTPFAFRLNADDADIPMQTVTYNITSENPSTNPVALDSQTGELTWTPSVALPKSLTIQASDDHTPPGTASIELRIDVTVPPPSINLTAFNDTYIVDQDSSGPGNNLPVIQNDTITPFETEFDIVIVEQGQLGNGTPGTEFITYVPHAGTYGFDTLTYKLTAEEGLVESNTATVTIFVDPTGDVPPTAPGLNRTTDEDTPLEIAPMVADYDDEYGETYQDLLSSAITNFTDGIPAITGVTNGTKGTAFVDDNVTITYTPLRDQNGDDMITYTVTDDEGQTATGNINITITPVNDAPVFQPLDNRTVNAGNNLNFTVMADDVEGDTLEYNLTEAPADAEITVDGNFSWTPTAADIDNHTVTIMVSDGQGGNASATITVRVVPADQPVNHPPTLPVIEDQTVPEGQTLQIRPDARDIDGDPLTYALERRTLPDAAVFNETTGHLDWTPGEEDGGVSHNITITVSDGRNGTDSQDIAITVEESNRPPVFVTNQTMYNGTVGEPFELDLNATDGDIPEQTITYRITDQNTPGNTPVTNSTNGLTREQGAPENPAVINATTGMISWTPDTHGQKLITVQASDDYTPNGTASITLNITVPNTAPTTTGATITVNQSGTESIDLAAAGHIDDAEQNATTLAVSINDTPAQTQGNATANGTTITYTANPTASGTDTISYTVTDDGGLNATGTINVTISTQAPPPNTPPTAGAVRTPATTGQTITIDLAPHVNDNEDAAADLAVSIAVQPTLGNASIAAGSQSMQYTAGQNAGTDTITYAVTDSGGLNATGTITITVSPPPNTPPTAPNFTHSTPAVPEQPLDISIIPRISDDAPLGGDSVDLPSQPNQGTATYDDGTITYTANAGARGTDTIQYRVTDAGGLAATGTITVTIQPPPVTMEPGLGSTVQIRQCTR